MAIKWEYWSCFLSADAEAQADFLKQQFPGWNVPKYAPQSMIPGLDKFGDEGWELVHMEPVAVGDNLDVFEGGRGMGVYTAVYFCVFKRPKQKLELTQTSECCAIYCLASPAAVSLSSCPRLPSSTRPSR